MGMNRWQGFRKKRRSGAASSGFATSVSPGSYGRLAAGAIYSPRVLQPYAVEEIARCGKIGMCCVATEQGFR